jgi:hypothetical protein
VTLVFRHYQTIFASSRVSQNRLKGLVFKFHKSPY